MLGFASVAQYQLNLFYCQGMCSQVLAYIFIYLKFYIDIQVIHY